LHDRIKVDGKAGQLGDNIRITRDGERLLLLLLYFKLMLFPGNTKLTVISNIPLSKRYLKYLTKKFLKKNSLRDWIRVVASAKDVYQLRFYNIE
jgi:large subunit ribosomal protein L22e